MGRFSNLTDRELDNLVAGKAPSGDPELADLAGFLHDVKRGLETPPSPETAARHLAAIAQAIDTAGGLQMARPGGRPTTSWLTRRLTVRNPLSTTRARLVVVLGATALMLAAFGGVAHAGALPSPLQHTVSDVAGG